MDLTEIQIAYNAMQAARQEVVRGSQQGLTDEEYKKISLLKEMCLYLADAIDAVRQVK